MQSKLLLSVISMAIAATSLPAPEAVPEPKSSSSYCSPTQVTACCNAISRNGTGVGCILSTLNILNPTCTAGQTAACCTGSQTGLINIACIPITITL